MTKDQLNSNLENKLKYKLLEKNILNDPDIFINAFLLMDEIVIDTVITYADGVKITYDPELSISAKTGGKELVVFEYNPEGIDAIIKMLRDNGTKHLLKGID